MIKEKYNSILMGIKDVVRDKIIHIGADDSLGAYTRSIIPQFREMYPLDDLKIIELGIINLYIGKIEPLDEPIEYDWKELYKFQITNKAVKDESEISKETDKQ